MAVSVHPAYFDLRSAFVRPHWPAHLCEGTSGAGPLPEVAYDKLAQMQRQDFSMLSDTEIYDKNDQLIGLINAGHYEYVPISQISMNLQNAYIAPGRPTLQIPHRC